MGDGRTVLVALAIGDYRNDFLEQLSTLIPDLTVVTGDVHLEPSYRASAHLSVPVTRVRNRYLLGRRLVLQEGSTLAAIRAEHCVIEHNPRFLNGWIVPLVRRGLGRPTVQWGHVESRGGRKPVIGRLRHLQRRLGGAGLYYTEDERRLAVATYGDRPPSFVAPNALYAAADWTPPPTTVPTDVVVIGRLTEGKKPELAVRAFSLARLAPGATLHVVGDGPDRERLERLAAELPMDAKHVVFHGHVADPARLAELFQRSITAVSPGYVGLSITQATWFGCPMVFSATEPHAPEVALARPDHNCIITDRTDAARFATALERAAERFTDPTVRRTIAEETVAVYTTEAMAAGLAAAVGIPAAPLDTGGPDAPVRPVARRLRTVVRSARTARLRATVGIVYGGRVSVGEDVAIGPRARVATRNHLVIADRVRIGADFVCEVDLEVGPDTLISSSVSIVGNDHPIDADHDVFGATRDERHAVRLEGDNLIGHRVTIVGSRTIGRGAVVGAGSVVTQDLEPDGVYAGVPARLIRTRRRS